MALGHKVVHEEPKPPEHAGLLGPVLLELLARVLADRPVSAAHVRDKLARVPGPTGLTDIAVVPARGPAVGAGGVRVDTFRAVIRSALGPYVRSLRAYAIIELREVRANARDVRTAIHDHTGVWEAAEKDLLDLVLMDAGSRQLAVIKEIQATVGVSFVEAETDVENAVELRRSGGTLRKVLAGPAGLIARLPEHEAKAAKAALERAGATVKLR